MGRLTDDSFELGLWTEGGLAENDSTLAPRTGAKHGTLISRRGFVGVSAGSTLTSETFTSVAGETVQISFWARRGAAFSSVAQLVVRIDDGDGVFDVIDSIAPGALTTEYQQFVYPIDVIAGGDSKVRFTSTLPATPSIYADSYYIDDVLVEGVGVAVELSERAIDAVAAMLLSDLGAALATIETEHGDGLALPVPAAADYYKREVREITGKVKVEVFEGSFDFVDPYIDADNNRAVAEYPVTVRITFTRTAGESPQQMVTIRRRYSAALKRLALNSPDLGGSDPSLQSFVSNGFDFEQDTDESDNVSKARVTARFTVRMEEVNS